LRIVDLTSYNVKTLFSDLEWGLNKNWGFYLEGI